MEALNDNCGTYPTPKLISSRTLPCGLLAASGGLYGYGDFNVLSHAQTIDMASPRADWATAAEMHWIAIVVMLWL